MDPFISTIRQGHYPKLVNVDSDSDIRFYETSNSDTAIEIWSDRGSKCRTRLRKSSLICLTLFTDDFFGCNFRIDHECQQLIQLAIHLTVFTHTYSQSSSAHFGTKL